MGQITATERESMEKLSREELEGRALDESPFTDTAPQGPDMIFTEDQVDDIVTILGAVRQHALSDVTVA